MVIRLVSFIGIHSYLLASLNVIHSYSLAYPATIHWFPLILIDAHCLIGNHCLCSLVFTASSSHSSTLPSFIGFIHCYSSPHTAIMIAIMLAIHWLHSLVFTDGIHRHSLPFT